MASTPQLDLESPPAVVDASPVSAVRAWRQARPISQSLLADLSLLLVTAIWGTTFVIVKQALEVFPPFTYIAIRFTLATLTLLLVMGPRLRRLRWAEARGGVLVGIFMFAGFALQTFGLQVTTASTAAFITGLNVVIVPIVALVWLRHRATAGALVGVAVATVGLGALSLNADFSLAFGDMLVVFCAVAFALQIVGVARFSKHTDALTFTFVQLATVMGFSWIGAFANERPAFVWDPAVVGALLFISVVATALVFCIQNAAQRHTSPTHTALIFTMEPVFAAFFAYIWLAEQLTTRAAVGGFLIIAGMLVAELWRKPGSKDLPPAPFPRVRCQRISGTD
jgi:drug/metabolite transporter (DMT)-like permease